jgi:hypothetical protein
MGGPVMYGIRYLEPEEMAYGVAETGFFHTEMAAAWYLVARHKKLSSSHLLEKHGVET